MFRRQLLSTISLAPIAFALSSCKTTEQQVITFTQSDLTYAKDALIGLQFLTTNSSVLSIANQVNTWISAAQIALTNIASSVGTTVSSVTLANILTDLQDACNAIATVLPNNTYVQAIQVVLAALSSAWFVISTNVASVSTMTLQQALTILQSLPVPASVAKIGK